MYKRITKKQCAIARQRADAIIRSVKQKLKDKYKFTPRLVGSGKWGILFAENCNNVPI